MLPRSKREETFKQQPGPMLWLEVGRERKLGKLRKIVLIVVWGAG